MTEFSILFFFLQKFIDYFPKVIFCYLFRYSWFIFKAVYGIIWHRIYPPFDDKRIRHSYDLSKGKEIAYLQAISFFCQKKK